MRGFYERNDRKSGNMQIDIIKAAEIIGACSVILGVIIGLSLIHI